MTDEEKFRFYPYSASYVEFYEDERRCIASALDDKASIEHVGSTSVPGLGGKRIIDIAVGTSPSGIDSVKGLLIEAGYEFRPHAGTEQRLFFRVDRVANKDQYRVHVHLVELNADDWRQLICFRDFLRNHIQVAHEYSRVKQLAASEAKGDGGAYMRLKEGFIVDTLRRALHWCDDK